MIKTTHVPTNVDSEVFDKDIYAKAGVFVWRNAIDQDTIKAAQGAWNDYYAALLAAGGRNLDSRNLVNFSNDLPPALADFWQTEAVKKVGIAIHGDDVALYNHRIVMKDAHSDHKVFLHQDYCYHMGFPVKCSLFIPVFDVAADQGAMTFHLGTHQYGFLGDAGEIDSSKFPEWPTITPAINAGDVIIMNSCLWHESGPNSTDRDRVLFDIIIQPANDPSGAELIAGEWKTDFWSGRKGTNDFDLATIFVNSRIKKLQAFYNNK